jgi:uncharacterized YkwD family protein
MRLLRTLLALTVASSLLLAMPGSAAAYSTTWSNWSSRWFSAYRTAVYAAPTTTAKSTAARTAAPTTTSTTAANSPEQQLLSLLNRERTQRGLRAVQSESTVTSVARLKSRDMVTRNYFSHTSPTYGSPAQMLARYNVRYSTFGENIAKAGGAARIHSMWMKSAGHRANILNPAFTHVGIGTAVNGAGYAATQIFIAR